MSRQPGIEVIDRARGRTYRVRYLDHGGARRSRSFDRKADAQAFQAKVRLAKRSGELAALDAGRAPLFDVADQWWRDHVMIELAESTRASYASMFNRYIEPRLGDIPVRAIDPGMIQSFDADLARDGVGAPTRRRVLSILQSVFRYAVVAGHVHTNPVQMVRKPSAERQRLVVPLGPSHVEAIRGALITDNRPGGATIVSVLGYGGLRPQEALALRWSDVHDQHLILHAKNNDGRIVEGFKHRSHRNRSVRLLDALAADLRAWRLRSGRPDDDAFVFARPGNRPWRDHDWRNFRKRAFRPAVAAAGIDTGTVPYDLRHAFASLLIASGSSIVEVAQQLGHSPAMTLRTYAHVIPELTGGGFTDPNDAVNTARNVGDALAHNKGLTILNPSV